VFDKTLDVRETGMVCEKRMREEGKGWQRKEGKRALSLLAPSSLP